MREAAKILRRSLIIAIAITALVGLVISLLFHRQAVRAEEARNAGSLHSIIEEVIAPPLRLSDYGEVKRVLERISRKGPLFGVIVPPQDIIVSDDQLIPRIQRVLKILPLETCLKSAKTVVETETKGETIACTRLDLHSDVMRSGNGEGMNKAVLLTITPGFFHGQDFRLLLMLMGTSIVVMFILTFILDRLVARALIQPLGDVAGALKGDSFVAAKHELERLDVRKFPVEIRAIVNSHRNLMGRLEEEMAQREALSGEAAKGELARQIAHDILSPLAALETVCRSVREIPEDMRIMIRQASSRIKDIANTLVRSGKKESTAQTETLAVAMLSSLIESIVTEKRIEFQARRGLEISALIDEAGYGLFINVNKREFERVISNLLNNAVEAIKDSGRVEIGIVSEPDCAMIRIRDDGIGIPGEVLPKLGQKGLSFGKGGGNGLGLYHARMNVARWGGSLHIDSATGNGATVELRIPKAARPDWFVPEIRVTNKTRVVSLDDDPSVHEIWKHRFGNNVETFVGESAFREWLAGNRNRFPLLCLIDYELIGNGNNGLGIIRELNLENISHLVTSRYDDESVRAASAALGVGIVPKSLAALVPIFVCDSKPARRGGAVLIDDDRLVQMTWRMAASASGVDFKGFSSPEEFERAQESIPREAEIYLDLIFPRGARGENYIARLKELGFTRITLASGIGAEGPRREAAGCPVIGKEPPFK